MIDLQGQFAAQPDGVNLGSSSQADVAELNKALEAGSTTGADTHDLLNASGAPIKVESLNRSVKHLTFKESDIRFWKSIPKGKAFNTVEEYNQLDSFGNDHIGGFISEGGLPEEENTVYVRRAALVKYMGVTKSVTHPMTLVRNNVGEIIQQETMSGMQWLLRRVDRGLFYSDSAIIPEAFDGYHTLHYTKSGEATLDNYTDSDTVIDLRGVRLSEATFGEAAETIINNFGYADRFISTPRTLTEFAKEFYGKKLIAPNTVQVSNGVMGQRVTAVETQYGRLTMDYDVFATRGPRKKIAGSTASNTKAPGAPVAGGTPTAAQTDAASSKFVAADAGDYFYAVSAVNKFGESALTLLDTSAETVAAGESVDLSFTAGSGTYAATGFIIYRGIKGEASTEWFYPIFRVTTAQLAAGYDGGAAGLVRDRNRYIANTDDGLVFETSTDVMEYRQLAPMMKMNLALLASSVRFMILQYGVPILYAPKKMVRIINIGTTAPA